MTRSALLAIPYMYDGDLKRVPTPIALWAFAETAELEISWGGMSISETVDAGYRYESDDGDPPEMFPPTSVDRAEFYAPGSALGTPDLAYPQPSVAVAALFGDVPTGPGSAALYGGWRMRTADIIFSDPVTMSVAVTEEIEGTASGILEYDTGIDPDGDGDSYRLKYSTLSGSGNKYLNLTANARQALYLASYGVWAAPVSGGGLVTTWDLLVNVLYDDLFWTLYSDGLHPEYAEILDAAVETVTADETEAEVGFSLPVGLSAISLSPPPSPATGTSWGSAPSVTANVVKQFARFLPPELA